MTSHDWQVAIEPESDPIRGVLSTTEHTQHEFIGWLELISAVEGARVDACAARRTPPSTEKDR